MENDTSKSARASRESTIWRIVRTVYLRLIGHHTGTDLLARPTAEQEQALDRWHLKMEQDCSVLAEVMDRARDAGITAAHVRMHVLEGVDHELVDEALGAARTDEDA